MNVVITLPKHLIDAIISGKKTFEMRKSRPKLMNVSEDGFFICEKGTKKIRCWCRCDAILEADAKAIIPSEWSDHLAVEPSYIEKYIANGHKIFMWHILEVVKFEKDALELDSLIVDKAPQQFAYCPLSYGRSY